MTFTERLNKAIDRRLEDQKALVLNADHICVSVVEQDLIRAYIKDGTDARVSFPSSGVDNLDKAYIAHFRSLDDRLECVKSTSVATLDGIPTLVYEIVITYQKFDA